MFKDTKKALERLEAELLAQEEEYEEEYEEEEEWEEDEDPSEDEEEPTELYRNFSNRYRAYNTDRTDWDPEDLGEALESRPKSGIWGLCAVVLLLVAGIFLLLAWLVQRNGGFL